MNKVIEISKKYGMHDPEEREDITTLYTPEEIGITVNDLIETEKQNCNTNGLVEKIKEIGTKINNSDKKKLDLKEMEKAYHLLKTFDSKNEKGESALEEFWSECRKECWIKTETYKDLDGENNIIYIDHYFSIDDGEHEDLYKNHLQIKIDRTAETVKMTYWLENV